MSTDRPRPGESDADLGADSVRDDDWRDGAATMRASATMSSATIASATTITSAISATAEPPDPLGQAMPNITEAHIGEAGPTARPAPSLTSRAR